METLWLALVLIFIFSISPSSSTSELKTYIVHVQPPESAIFATSTDRESWYKSFLPAPAESRLVHTYSNVATGFAARLTEQELEQMSKMDGFVHASPDRAYSRKTTHTPSFLGLSLQGGLWGRSNLGEGVIIGVLDGGIVPNHPSFDDAGMPPPPAKWKGRCEFSPPPACNNKLIGARSFFSGAVKGGGGGGNASTSLSPVDNDGHGTHVASTAAGAFVPGASVQGNAGGTASGMAPKAHLAIYKVCGFSQDVDCAGSDVLAGLDAAVADGVDVLSLSLGDNNGPFYQDNVAVGGFHAIEKGVLMSCAAGNSGPVSGTLSNEAPWLLTVAASTMDRSIRSTVQLGNELQFEGETLFQPESFKGPFPLVYAGASNKTDAHFCGEGALDGFDVKGKIVLCDRGGGIARITKGDNVKSAGGAGMILANAAADAFSTIADFHSLPACHVSFADGAKIKSYIEASRYPTATIVFKGTVLGTSPAPAITSFSSRGPSQASPGILKPDITGPGVSVLAAWFEPVPANQTGAAFNVESGTSMSTPHLSGIAALIKSVYPIWSPAAIKSAMMTTADVVDNTGKPILDERNLPAGLFAIGSGHVNPVRASDPGLVYDLGPDDYIRYLCGLKYTSAQIRVIANRPVDCSTVKSLTEAELNYPSISVDLGSGTRSVTVRRTVRNVGEARSSYYVEVGAPAGAWVGVVPKRLDFWKVGQEITFTVTISKTGGGSATSQGYLKWVSGKRTVRSPISVTFK